MLNPKLQTLNSFGFLRESKKTLNIPGTLLQEIIITSRIENFQSTARTLRASSELWNSNAKSTAKITAHSRCVSKQNAPLLQQRFQHHMNCIQVKANCNIKSKVNLWTFLPFTQENINQDKIHVQCKWNQLSFLLWRQLSLWYISKTMVDLISPATGMSSIYGWPIQSWWCNNLVSNVDIPLPPLHIPIFPIPKQRHVAHHWSGTLLALCRPTCHPRPSSCSRMAWTWSGKASYPPVVPHSWGLPDSTPWSDVPSLWLPYR